MGDEPVLGQQFASYDEFEQFFNDYCMKNNVEFWKRDVRYLENVNGTIHSAATAKKELKYYFIKLCCRYGGRKFKKTLNPKGDKKRRETMKLDCPAYMTLVLSKEGDHLRISNVDMTHNHDTNEELYKCMPKQRRLPADLQKQASHLLKMHFDKKLLRDELVKKTGKVILLKDLSNISTKYRTPVTFDDIVENLRSVYKCTVDLFYTEGTLLGIFFQDKEMTAAFNEFPERLYIDSTPRLLHSGFMSNVFMIEDDYGCTQIVGVGLLAHEDEDSMDLLIENFKFRNESSVRTKLIMTDQAALTRKVLSEKFPLSDLRICTFHTLTAFKKEVNSRKLGITRKQQKFVRNTLSSMCYCRTEQQYLNTYENLVQVCPQPVINYFKENWHDIRTEWTYIGIEDEELFHDTNKKLESVNSKLKSLILPHSTLSTLIENIFFIVSLMRMERDYVSDDLAADYEPDSLESQYHKYLQPYAFEFVLKQIESFRNGFVEREGSNASGVNKEKEHSATSKSCSCSFFTSLRLPCKHILVFRATRNLPLFDEKICDKRWSREYFSRNHKSFIQDEDCMETDVSSLSKTNDDLEDCQESQSILFTDDIEDFTDDSDEEEDAVPISETNSVPETQEERYRQTVALADELAYIASQCSGDHFTRKINLFQSLIRIWKSGQEVDLSVVTPPFEDDDESDEPRLNTSVPSSSHIQS